MSIFGSQTTWPESAKACGAPHQSPINLSQTFALPCDLLCDFEFDEVSVPDAQVYIDDNGILTLSFNQVRPTAKYKGDGYTALYAKFYNPSQHTIEGVQSQAEFVVYMNNPNGKNLAVSVLVRTTPSGSASSSFFSSFIPFANSETPNTIGLGSTWMLRDMLPAEPSFYMYSGSDIVPACEPMTWVVFSNTVNMDPSDFAKLGNIAPAGSRNLQPVGDRDVFFNDTTLPTSTPQIHDNKVYMRCRRAGGSSGGGKAVLGESKPAGLQEADQKATQEANQLATSNTTLSAYMFFMENWSLLLVVAVAAILGYLAFYTTTFSSLANVILSILMWFPNKLNTFIWKKSAFGKTISAVSSVMPPSSAA